MVTVFISYRRGDSVGHTGRLRDRLLTVLGSEQVFRDLDSIPLGVDFRDALSEALDVTDVLLAVIGPRWLTATDQVGQRRLDDPRDLVRVEIATALARPDVRVVPVLVEGASLPHATALPIDLRPLVARQALSLRDDRWDDDVARLVEGIGGDRAPAPPRPWRRRAVATAGLALVPLLLLGVWMAGGDPDEGTDPDAPPDASQVVAEGADAEPGDAVDAGEGSGEGADEGGSGDAGIDEPDRPFGWKINFQPVNAEVPDGYLVDSGEPFGPRTGPNQGEGLSYGWVDVDTGEPTSMVAHNRERTYAPDVVDQRFNTLVHFRRRNPNTDEIDEASWELAVPDGRYWVTASVGDQEGEANPSTHTLLAEGEPVVTGFQSSESQRFRFSTVGVEVTDGRLTLEAGPGTGPKINFVEVTERP